MSRVGRFWSDILLPVKPWQRLCEIHQYYTDDRIGTLLMPLLRQTNALSLRALDWLVTNYAKKYHIVIRQRQACTMPINIHGEYKNMLTHWRRRYFDPFRRHQRIYFKWHDPQTEQTITEHTTVGQLNFLYWVETRGIYAYALQHVQDIDADMASTMAAKKSQRKQDKVQGVKRKRKELTETPLQPCFICPMALTFSLEAEAALTTPL